MGDILKHITELIEQHGRPYEQPRPINQLPNFFDALDGCGFTSPDPAATDKNGPGSKGKPQAVSNLNEYEQT
jgi:hypothetical protein